MRSTAKTEAVAAGAIGASVRERRAIALAAALAVAVASYAGLRAGEAPAEPPSPQHADVASAAIETGAGAAEEPQAPPAPPALPSLTGFTLHGVSGGAGRGAALIGFPAGPQRLVRLGREVRPGLKLQEVGLDYAVIGSPGGAARLELRRFGIEGPDRPALPAAPANDRRFAAAAGAEAMSEGSHRDRTLQFRLGLAPVKAGGRTTGFSLRPGARLPVLEAAGLRAGDVIVAVNGQAFESEERVLDLSREIAGSYAAEFEFLRNGLRQKAIVEVNKRPSE